MKKILLLITILLSACTKTETIVEEVQYEPNLITAEGFYWVACPIGTIIKYLDENGQEKTVVHNSEGAWKLSFRATEGDLKYVAANNAGSSSIITSIDFSGFNITSSDCSEESTGFCVSAAILKIE